MDVIFQFLHIIFTIEYNGFIMKKLKLKIV